MQELTKQQKLDKFVDQNIHHLCNHYIQLLREHDFDEFNDSVQNMYFEDEISELEIQLDELEADNHYRSDQIQEQIQELQDSGKEVYQWFFISSWLAEKLLAKNEVIFDSWDGQIWGRTCCGQSIVLDSVIESIYDDLQGV